MVEGCFVSFCYTDPKAMDTTVNTRTIYSGHAKMSMSITHNTFDLYEIALDWGLMILIKYI